MFAEQIAEARLAIGLVAVATVALVSVILGAILALRASWDAADGDGPPRGRGPRPL